MNKDSNKTLKFINRGHDLQNFENAVKELQKRNINVVVHIINGLPNESKEDMINTLKFVNNHAIDGIKIHMLHILKNTKLEVVGISHDNYIEAIEDTSKRFFIGVQWHPESMIDYDIKQKNRRFLWNNF